MKPLYSLLVIMGLLLTSCRQQNSNGLQGMGRQPGLTQVENLVAAPRENERVEDYLSRAVPGYAGCYFSDAVYLPGNRTFVIALAGRHPGKMSFEEKRHIENIFITLYNFKEETTFFTFDDVKYSFKELEYYQEKIMPMMNHGGIISSAELNFLHNKIWVYLHDLKDKAQAQKAIEALGVPVDMFAIVGTAEFSF